MRVVKDESLTVLKQDFDNRCTMELEIRQLQVARVLGRLDEIEGIAVDFVRTS